MDRNAERADRSGALKTFLHLRSVLAVGVLTMAFVILAAEFLDTESNIPGIATTVFQVAGTMVALTLPAAELLGQAVTRVADYWLDVVFRSEKIPEKDKQMYAENGCAAIQEAQEISMFAWRALGYVLAALFLSSIALFINLQVVLCSYDIPLVSWFCSIPLIYWLLGLTLGFLLVGSYWFFPAAWWFLNLKTLQHTQNIFKGYITMSGQLLQRNPGAVTGTDMTVSPERAREIANDYIANDRRFSPGTKIGEAESFYGYYTLHTEKDGEITGMLIVNGYSGKVIYYSFAMEEED